jgi:predicted alpha/beta hydrolase family esterase
MHIKVESEEELKEIAATLLHLSVNMRHWQQQWQEHHGSVLLNKKRDWEERMDEYLKKLGAERTNKQHEVNISIQSEE